MKKFFSWTVIFRGNFRRNGNYMVKRLYNIVVMLVSILKHVTRFLLRVICFVLGIDWIRLEQNIQRRLRIYFT